MIVFGVSTSIAIECFDVSEKLTDCIFRMTELVQVVAEVTSLPQEDGSVLSLEDACCLKRCGQCAWEDVSLQLNQSVRDVLWPTCRCASVGIAATSVCDDTLRLFGHDRRGGAAANSAPKARHDKTPVHFLLSTICIAATLHVVLRHCKALRNDSWREEMLAACSCCCEQILF